MITDVIKNEMDNKIEENRKKNTDYINYTEKDSFTLKNQPVLSVLDFWRYCYGDLAGQSPVIAEFLVAKALGIKKAENVTYWTAYDMSYRNMRIEVKATEYIHPWNKNHVSNVRTFSIAPSNNSYWGRDSERKLSRQNDLYVFCLNTNKELQNPKPLELDFWDFYVLDTERINEYTSGYGNPDQKKISLNVIKQMAGNPVKWDQLKQRIDEVVDEIQNSRG